MLLKTLRSYDSLGLTLGLGSPRFYPSHLVEIQSGRWLSSGYGISVTDFFLFMVVSRYFRPSAIFVIGNACGISTLSLAELFPEAVVDAIDAQTEGDDNRWGSVITRALAEKYFNNVRLTIGFSPQDLAKAMRMDVYDLVFIDGLHTNEQLVADFEGLRARLAPRAVLVLHDVALASMLRGWEVIKKTAIADSFSCFEATFTQFGSAVMSRGNHDLETYLALACGRFRDVGSLYRLSSQSLFRRLVELARRIARKLARGTGVFGARGKENQQHRDNRRAC